MKSIFQISNSILTGISIHLNVIDQSEELTIVDQSEARNVVDQSKELNEPVVEEPVVSREELQCSTCGIPSFESLKLKRQHFKSDWHNYNVSKKIKNQVSVSEDEFYNLEDLGSIDGSVSSNEQVAKVGSPFVNFEYSVKSDSSEKRMELLVYKQVLANKKQFCNDSAFWIDALLKLQKSQQWAIFMLASGHFCGAVIDCNTGKLLVHKTFHRYTTRRKQGGAQSGNDSSKGNAKSAGAWIRRYNEAALQDEVQSLLKEWKNKLSDCSLVFVRANGNNHNTIFFDDSILSSADSRIRSIPFTTKRPTLAELERCFQELTSLKTQEILQDDLRVPVPKIIPMVQPKTHLEILPEKNDLQAKFSNDQLKLIELVKKGRLDALKNALNTRIQDLNLLLPDGKTLLHIAADSGNEPIVEYLLEQGADPTIKSSKRGLLAYDLSDTRQVRDTFRRFMAKYPDKWNYKEANIPGPLTREMEEKQKHKDLERRKKEKERKRNQNNNQQPEPQVPVDSFVSSSTRQLSALKLSKTEKEKIGLSPQLRQKLDREKRALAAEARLNSQQNKCSACKNSLINVEAFEKSNFRYCSMDCLKSHDVLFR